MYVEGLKFRLTDFLSHKSRFNSSKNERIILLKIKPEIFGYGTSLMVGSKRQDFLLRFWARKKKNLLIQLKSRKGFSNTIMYSSINKPSSWSKPTTKYVYAQRRSSRLISWAVLCNMVLISLGDFQWMNEWKSCYIALLPEPLDVWCIKIRIVNTVVIQYCVYYEI